MIHYVKGDIFESEADYIANAVNCNGFMGAGLALAFKKACSPEYFETYRIACKLKTLQPGVLRFFFDHKIHKWVIDFPTMDDKSMRGSFEVVLKGLVNLESHIRHIPIKSVALPALGCGIGKLNWEHMKGAISVTLGDADCEVFVYEPR